MLRQKPAHPTTATPLPETPQTVKADVKDHEINIKLGDRNYRIRGIQKNLSYEQLNVNVLVRRDEYVHIDTFDIYSSRPQQAFIKQSATELGVQDEVIKKDPGKVLLKLEELQENRLKTPLSRRKKSHP